MQCKFCGHPSMPPFYSAFNTKRKRYPDQCFDKSHNLTSDTLYCPKCGNKNEAVESGLKVGDLHPNCGGILKQSYRYYEISVCKKCHKEQL